MATREAYIPYNSPFKGVSVLPARLAQGGFSPLAINCDTSQGVLRARPGYTVVNQAPNERILGCHSTLDYDGSAQVISITFQAHQTRKWGKIQFRVMTPAGEEIFTDDLSSFPRDVPPSPYEFPTFVDFMSATYILFRRGAMYKWDTLSMTLTKVKTQPVASSAIFPYFESIPDGKVMEAHGRRLFIAGFDGDKSIGGTTNIPSDQNLIPESVVGESRGAVTLPQNAIVFSDFDNPNVYKAGNFLAIPKGQRVTAMASTQSELLVFSEQTVSVVRGFNENGMQISTVAQGVGCVSQRTVVHGQGMICWMSHNGWYMYAGGQIRKISDDIGDMFRLEGWRETPMRELGEVASSFQYPLCIAKTILWQSCGGYDFARGAFIWSIPMLGQRSWREYNEQYNSLPARSNNLTVVYYPTTGTWDMWAPSTTSGFYPTCYTSVLEGSNQYLMFGNEDGQMCIWGADTQDKIQLFLNPSDPTRPLAGQIPLHVDSFDAHLTWFWMSPRLQPASNLVGSVRSLRVRQRAVGYQDDADKVKFLIETERSFDQNETALSAVGYLDGSPDTGPPNPKIPNHYWNQGSWSNFRWAGRDVWKARYGVKSVITGHTIRVGFTETIDSDKDFLEVHGFDIELQPRRDVT